MKSASLLRYFSLKRVAAVAVLSVGLAGCGGGISPEMITYNHAAYRQQGIEKFDKSDYVNAASSFKEALRQEPGDYTSRYYLGQCYDKMGHPQQAIEEYRTTLNGMTHSLEGKGDFQTRGKVLEALAQAIAHEPDRSGDIAIVERQERTPENRVLLARISRYSGDADTALVHYQEAQQIDPASQPVAKEYGLYLEQLGQTRKADWQLRHAYAMNTRDEEVAAALRRLGVVPGPSLKTEDQLEKPFLPVGPLPEVDLSTSNKSSAPPQTPVNTGAVGTSSSPRD